MPMDFPSSPTEGQVFVPGGGAPVYTYRAPGWRRYVNTSSETFDNTPYVKRNGVWERFGWRYLGRLEAVSAAASGSLIFPIPPDIKHIRISGLYKMSAVSVYLMGRVSIDGGLTFKAAATDYVYTIFYNQGGTTVAGGSAQFSSFYMTYSSDAANRMSRNIHCLFLPGEPGQNCNMESYTEGYFVASGPVCMTFGTNLIATGRATHLQLITNTGGTIGAGTVVTFEGI